MSSFSQALYVEDLRYRIVLQKQTITTDANGIEAVTWPTVKTVWAAYEPVSGREYYAAAAINSENNVTFRIRYQKDITPDMQIFFNNQVYQILDILDTGGRHIELQLISKVITRG